MQIRRTTTIAAVVAILLLAASSTLARPQGRLTADNPNPPASPVKLIFIHHSCGENWLSDWDGGLGLALRSNNYFVSDTNYGWGPNSIGDNTDIGHWWDWFCGPNSTTYLGALYTEYDQHSSYSRLSTDPGGENEIIMFKSCYPNSNLGGSPDDPPEPPGEWLTVGGAKYIYNTIRDYFETRTDKLFVVITAPPVTPGDSWEPPANARAFNNWLVNDWLDGYPYDNVAVFDFYNVLTSNGGNANTNDLDWESGNHHRWWNGAVQHVKGVSNNYSAYGGGSGGGSHPTAAGNQKATGEFVPLLNVYYNRWAGGAETPTPTTTGPPSTATPTATATATRTLPPSTATATASPTPTPTGTPPTGQQTMTFQNGVYPDASYAGTTDATITTWSGNSYANLGGLEYLQVGETGDADEFRFLVRFELNGWLPADIQINEAWLELRAYDGGYDDDPHDVVAHRVIEEWVEGDGWDLEADGRGEGVTWMTARPGVNWATPGGDFDLAELDRVTVAANPDGWYRWDVTSAVRAWADGTASNHGLLLEPDNAPWAHHEFRSSEYSTPNLRSRLIVAYTVGGADTPTPTPSATPVSPGLPDLIVNSMKIELETGDSCDYTSTQLGVRVWVENIGGGDACPFVVDVNGSQQDITSGLAAGQITSTWLADSYVWPGADNTAFADATFLVEESSEDNNQLTQLLPMPTLPPTCTPTPTSTPPTYRFVYLPLILKNWSVPLPTPTPTPTTVIPAGLIQPADLVYEGAFRLPDGPPEIGWEWSGAAMAYYPDGDPSGPADGYPGSIFGAGHNWNQYVSEISIPVPVNSPSRDVNQLNTAATLQGFYNIRGDLFGEFEIPRVGLEYLPAQGAQTTGKLYFCWAQHMGEGDTNPSHGWCELSLSNPQTAGAWRIGNYWNYVTTDYIFAIPQAWADACTPGMYLATGRFRDGGQGAQGPSLLAYGPWNEGNPPAPGSTLPAVSLLLYGNAYTPGSPTMNNYQHSDEWAGGAWLTAGNKAAVIFVGTKGTGDCWYGCSDGTVWPDEPPFPPDCPERGWWSTAFEGQILFYDPADLAAVARGDMETWEPQPYATLNVDQYLYHVESSQQKEHVGAASFDRQRGLLYVFEPLADGDKSLVHVWRIAG